MAFIWKCIHEKCFFCKLFIYDITSDYIADNAVIFKFLFRDKLFINCVLFIYKQGCIILCYQIIYLQSEERREGKKIRKNGFYDSFISDYSIAV